MTTPYSFQIRGARQIARFGGRALLADEMGLGKTFQALLYLNRHPEAMPAVVVCPASLKLNWEREASVHFGIHAEVCDGKKPWADTEISRRVIPDITVISYNLLHPWMQALKRLNPRAVILDECHYLINTASMRTKMTRVLCKGVPHVLALSGTPMVNRPAELWPVLNILRPDLWPKFQEFGERYCRPRWRPWGWEYKGASRLGELNEVLLREVMIRRLKGEVLQELPEQVRCVVPLRIDNRREYEEAESDFIRWLAAKDVNRAKRAATAEQLTKLGYLKRLAGQLKAPHTVRWVEEWLEGGAKLVLFGVHNNVLDPIYQRFRKLAVKVDGSTPLRERELYVRQFQRNKKTRLFVGNIIAAGTGITLTEGSAVAFAEYDWVPGNHSQAEKRIDRIGQRNCTQSFWLTAKGTIEERLAKVLQDKSSVANQALDGGRNDQLDVMDLMLEEFSKGAP